MSENALSEPPAGFVGIGRNDGVWYERHNAMEWERRWFTFGYEIPDTWAEVVARNPDGLIRVKKRWWQR